MLDFDTTDTYGYFDQSTKYWSLLDPFWCDVLRTEVTERLDDEAGRTAGSRIVPASVWRRSAEVMAGRLATSRKWRGVKTHPLPCPLMRSSIDFSVDC